jgi:hypothetical protein
MCAFNTIFPVGAVSQMTEPNSAGKSNIFLQPLRLSIILPIGFSCLSVLCGNLGEDARNRLWIDRPVSADIPKPRFDIYLDIDNPCPVLTAVMLLFPSADIAYLLHRQVFRTYQGSIEVVCASG